MENNKTDNMAKYNHNIEDWWRHNGIGDRIQASGIFCYDDIPTYLQKTDDWWNSRTNEEKAEIYEEFFSED